MKLKFFPHDLNDRTRQQPFEYKPIPQSHLDEIQKIFDEYKKKAKPFDLGDNDIVELHEGMAGSYPFYFRNAYVEKQPFHISLPFYDSDKKLKHPDYLKALHNSLQDAFADKITEDHIKKFKTIPETSSPHVYSAIRRLLQNHKDIHSLLKENDNNIKNYKKLLESETRKAYIDIYKDKINKINNEIAHLISMVDKGADSPPIDYGFGRRIGE